MLFTDLPFFILLSLTLGVYYLCRSVTQQTATLVISSFIFYSYHTPALLLLLLVSVITNTLVCFFLVNSKAKSQSIAGLGVSFNLIILIGFKYFNLLNDTIFHLVLPEILQDIPLPIGISFYTFQGISLVIDLKRKDVKYNFSSFSKSLLDISLFISFFPQLIAGPIVKAKDFLPQIKLKRFSNINFQFAFKRIVEGYFLKMVIANNLKDLTFFMQYPYFQRLSSFELFTLLNGYSLQIFSDFAGYSLIAIGISALFGYHLPENFNFPYLASSFQDFWRRWHISLSTFLKEYLYFSLGGNRRGSLLTKFNLFLTMVIGGMWHGAAWSYMVWGVYHGGLLVIERIVVNKIQNRIKLHKIIKILIVYSLVTFGWLLFKLPNFSDVIDYLHAMISNRGKGFGSSRNLFVFLYGSPLFITHFLRYKKIGFEDHWLYYGLMIASIALASGSTTSFIYFQF